MHRFRLLLAFALSSTSALAAQNPFDGVYKGEGRACFGGLYLRERSLDRHASFFRCGPVRYRRIAQEEGSKPRLAVQLEGGGKTCGLKVVELKYYSEWSWTVNGYPSRDAYDRREEPGWKDAVTPGRQIASCGMRKD